jgi:hypothetical protein
MVHFMRHIAGYKTVQFIFSSSSLMSEKLRVLEKFCSFFELHIKMVSTVSFSLMSELDEKTNCTVL